MQIYNDAYFARIIDSLKEDFPTVVGCLGEESFRELGRAYLEQYPEGAFAALADAGNGLVAQPVCRVC